MIVVIGLIQWITAFRGDLLWIGMVGLGLLLTGNLLTMFQGRDRATEQPEPDKRLFGSDGDWPHDHDPAYLGSPLNRSPFHR
jgi:hypothetical protein